MECTSIDEVVCVTGNGDIIEYRITNNDGDVLATTYGINFAKAIRQAIEDVLAAKAKHI